MRREIAIVSLLLVAALTVGASLAIPAIQTEVDFVDTVPTHPGLGPYREILANLDGVRFAAIYMAKDPNIASLREDGFESLVSEQGALTEYLENQFGGDITYTLSAWEGMRQGNYMLAKIATAGNPPASSYSIPSDPITYDLVRDRALGDGSFDDVLAADGSSALMLFFLGESAPRDLVLEINNALKTWALNTGNHPATEEHQSTGLLYASAYTDEKNVQQIRKFAPFALGASALVIIIFLRRIDDAAIALVSAALPLVWLAGSIALLGIPISFLTFVLAPIILGIGIDGSIHFLLAYQKYRSNLDRQDSVREAMREKFRPILTSGLTTSAGLAVLWFVPAPLFSEIGVVAAVGMLFAILAQLVVTPALRRIIPDLRHAKRVTPPSRRTSKWQVAVAILSILLLVPTTIYSLNNVEIGSGQSDNEFPQDDPVIQLQHRLEAEYGAFQKAYITYSGDLTDPAALQAIHASIAKSATIPSFVEASSITKILLANEATDQGAVDIGLAAILAGAGQAPSEEARLPQSKAEAISQLDEVFADPLWGSIAPFTMSRDYKFAITAITIRPWNSTAELTELRDALVALENDIRATAPAGLEIHAAGSPMNRAAIVEQTPADVAIAMFGSAAAVFVLIILTQPWRRAWNVKLAGVATVVVLLAGAVVLSSVYYLDAIYSWLASQGAPANSALLNDMFLIAFAITMAAGVDDVVHLGSALRKLREINPAATIGDAWLEARRGILATTFSSSAAFAAMAPIYFLQSKNLAILTTIGLLAALYFTFFVGRVLLGISRPQTSS